MFAPLDGAGASPEPPRPHGEWTAVIPVPSGVPGAPSTHPRLGAPSSRWVYLDDAERLLGQVCRFDLADGGKEFLPLTWCRHSISGAAAWRWKSWMPPRPIYGVDRLAARRGAPVLVCEGEKASDAAARLLPAYVTVTSPHGSKSAAKADWSALAGRDVTIWPDNDEPGAAYAAAVAQCLGAIGVIARIGMAPAGVPEGWDAADAERDGWSQARALALVQAAKPPAKGPRSRGQKQDGATPAAAPSGDDGPQRDLLFDLLEGAELWHDPDREAFATVPVNGHFENMAVRERGFRLWLVGAFYAAHRRAPGGQALEDGLRCIEASAVNEGRCFDTFRRVGEDGAGLYLDLGTPDWRAAAMTADGWTIVERAPVKFIRSRAMRPLPVPEAGELIETLREFVNCDDADFKLFVAWLVAALRPRGPFPLLVIGGEQGASKSTVTRLARELVDPNASPIRAAPKDDRDLLVAAYNSWTLAYDNLSSVRPWLSDALCRLATGGGFSTRTLHSDRDETVFTAQRPVILNGISDLAARPDLQDRAISLSLPAIAESERRPEREFWRAFAVKAPFIMGALLDAVCAGLLHLPDTRLEQLPRMADFVLWAEAAAPGLGWEPGEFSRVYASNRAGTIQVSLENSIVAQAVWTYILSLSDPGAGFDGTASELLLALEAHAGEAMQKSRHWPRSAAELGGQLRRVAPVLRAVGITIETEREGKDRKRKLRIRRVAR